MTEDRDRRLTELYRQASQETPPAHVDRAILEQARKSRRRKVYAPFGSNWLAGGAMLGVILLSVLLLLDMPREQDLYLPVPPPPPVPDAEAPLSDEVMQEPAASAPVSRKFKLESMAVEPLPPPPPPPEMIYLQTSTPLDRAHAVALRSRLTELGYQSEMRQAHGDDTVYRVYIGPFADPEALDQAQQRLDKLGIESRVATAP